MTKRSSSAAAIWAIEGTRLFGKMYFSIHGSHATVDSRRPDRVQNEEAARREAPARHVEERPVVPEPDVLEHADRHDRVEGPGEVAIVLEEKVYGQPGGPRTSQLDLLSRDGDADDRDSVALRREDGEAAPAAADVEDAHSRLEARLPAEEVQLRLLRLVQSPGRVQYPQLYVMRRSSIVS